MEPPTKNAGDIPTNGSWNKETITFWKEEKFFEINDDNEYF